MSGEDRLKPHDTKAAKAMIKREIKKEEDVTTEDVKPEKKSRKRKKAPSSTTGSDSGLATSPRSQRSPEFQATNMSDYGKDSPTVVVSEKSSILFKPI